MESDTNDPDFEEDVIQRISLNEQTLLNNFQECQKYFFPLPKSPFCFKTMIPPSDNAEQSFVSCDLFGIGPDILEIDQDDSQLVTHKVHVSVSKGCVEDDIILENTAPEFDEVFSRYDKDCAFYNKGLPESGRSQSLPDLVPNAPESPDLINGTDKINSPDVVQEHRNNHAYQTFVEIDEKNCKGSKYNLEGPVHHAVESTLKRHQSFKRSVSFDPNLKLKEKRESYRKSHSSGYGTGDNDASVSVSQSQDSTCSGLGENVVCYGNINLQESSTGENIVSECSDTYNSPQTIISEHKGLNYTITATSAMSSGNHPHFDLFESSVSFGSKASLVDSRAQTSASHRTVPKFEDLLDESIFFTSADFLYDSETGPDEMLKTVQEEYCPSSPGSYTDGCMLKTSPGFSTNLAMAVFEEKNSDDRRWTIDLKTVKKDMHNFSSDMKDDLRKYHFEDFMKNLADGFPNANEMYKELVDNMDLLNTPSTSPSYISVKDPDIQELPLYKEAATSLKTTDGVRKIQACELERAYRCRDRACMDKMCRKVKDSMLCILENKQNPDNQTCIEIYDSLWEHCKECCQLKCSVPWCCQLQVELDHIDEFDLKKVEAIVKSCLQSPLMQFASFDLNKGKFIKLDNAYPDDGFREWQLLYSLGYDKNTIRIRQSHKSNNVSVNFILKKMPKFEYNQQLEVYTRLLKMSHPNLIPHLWVMDYEDYNVMHICTPFMQYASLEEYLYERQFLVWEEAIGFICQVIDAVIHLHTLGIIYLNWKSANVLFANPIKVQLSNMSSSVCKGSECDVGSTLLCLPPSIVTPELLLGDAKLCKKSDVWGAGCLLKEILSTRPVWHEHRHETAEVIWEIIRRSDHPPLPDRLTEWQKAIFMNCWKKCPEERISLEELENDLRSGGSG